MAVIVNKFKGLVPALDRRQVPEPFVIDGRNFLFTTQGPASVFGRRCYSYTKIQHPEVFQSIVSNDRFFIFLDNCILFDDLTLDTFVPSFSFPQNLTMFPWSSAFVGGKYYFAKKDSPLIEYAPEIDEWSIVESAHVPTGLVACTQASGRLILLGRTIVVYSAIDDGRDLEPDAGGTGAGFQLTAIAGGGDPLAVKEVNQGFITYLKGGMMFSQTIEADVPFRHLPLATDAIPVSPYAIVDIDKRSHIVLAQTGLYIINSAQPEPWQPLISEYLTNTLFERISPSVAGTYRLFYDPDRKIFFLSTSSGPLFQFDVTLVLYLPRDEWGYFNQLHSQIFNLAPLGVKQIANAFSGTEAAVAPTALAYITPDGHIFEVSQIAGLETFQDSANFYYFYDPPGTVHANLQNNIWHFPTVATGLTFDATGVTVNGIYDTQTQVEYFEPLEMTIDETHELTPVAVNEPFSDGTFFDDGTGFYDYPRLGTICGVQTGFLQIEILPYIAQYAHLDSEIAVGVFRMGDEEQINRTFSIHDLTIGVAEPTGDQIEVDYNLIDGEEDWNILDGEEDWGEGIISGSNFVAELLVFIDGYNIFQEQVHDLRNNILRQDNKNFRYTLIANAFYAGVKLKTEEVGDYYELKTIEFNTIADGIAP